MGTHSEESPGVFVDREFSISVTCVNLAKKAEPSGTFFNSINPAGHRGGCDSFACEFWRLLSSQDFWSRNKESLLRKNSGLR